MKIGKVLILEGADKLGKTTTLLSVKRYLEGGDKKVAYIKSPERELLSKKIVEGFLGKGSDMPEDLRQVFFTVNENLIFMRFLEEATRKDRHEYYDVLLMDRVNFISSFVYNPNRRKDLISGELGDKFLLFNSLLKEGLVKTFECLGVKEVILNLCWGKEPVAPLDNKEHFEKNWEEINTGYKKLYNSFMDELIPESWNVRLTEFTGNSGEDTQKIIQRIS